MVAKRIITIGSIAVLASAAILFYSAKKMTTNFPQNKENTTAQVQSPKPAITKPIQKYDLYSTTPYDLPLTSIVDISKLPLKAKSIVDKALDSAQGFYYLKYFQEEGRIFIVLQNSISESEVFSRHNLEIMEIFIDDKGEITKTVYAPAYTGQQSEIFDAINNYNKKDEIWELDNSFDSPRPLKHIVFDDRGKQKFSEYWNYTETEKFKYVMKDSRQKVVSILKETLEGDSTYRQEHIFYDKDGNTIMSLSANYDGADITRLMFYDSINPETNINIISEYSEGKKIKESLYNNDYQLINTTTAEYVDEKRVNIKIFDKENNIISEISS